MYEIPVFEVYLDMLFILNFMMDFFIFWMVGKITYQKVSWKRLCFGSIIGAVLYCLVVITPFLRTKNIMLYLIILPLTPIQIIFRPKTVKNWIQTFIIANITALVVGGMSYGMIYWVKEQNIVSNIYQITSEGFSIWILIFSILGSYIVIQISRYYLQRRNTNIQKLYQIKIRYDQEEVVFEALLDTGNKVYDPISKHPVIIAEYQKLKELLPEEVNRCYDKKEVDITHIVQEASNSDFGSRIRLIPYHSLGNPNGILLGFKADCVYIGAEGLKDSLVEDVIVAIYQHNLSGEDTYHGLIHGDLVS